MAAVVALEEAVLAAGSVAAILVVSAEGSAVFAAFIRDLASDSGTVVIGRITLMGIRIMAAITIPTITVRQRTLTLRLLRR